MKLRSTRLRASVTAVFLARSSASCIVGALLKPKPTSSWNAPSRSCTRMIAEYATFQWPRLSCSQISLSRFRTEHDQPLNPKTSFASSSATLPSTYVSFWPPGPWRVAEVLAAEPSS